MDVTQDKHQLLKRTDALKKENPGKAFESLKRRKEEVLDAWEAWVRQEVEPANQQETIVVRDHFAVWLDRLIETLDPNNSGRSIDFQNELNQETGLHRAVTPGYCLPTLLKEYSLLRKAIVMMLDEDTPLELSEREIINEALDTALSLAANEFAKYQQSQIKVALMEAEKSNRDLEHFAAIAAHDLKAPLATVTGYLDVLREDVQERCPGSVNLLDVATNNSRRMLALIDRLLEYAKIRSQQPEFVEVDLSDIANVAVENLKATIEKRNAVVHHENLPKIRGDVSLLIQLFQNLIANGIKFNHRDMPEVAIRCRSDKGNWVIDFQDNGIGFDPQEKHSIFEPHKRLHRNEFQGSGLGLATVKRVVELHEGNVSADSQPGKGAKFSVSLPEQ